MTLTYTETKNELKKLGYTGKLSGKGVTLDYLTEELSKMTNDTYTVIPVNPNDDFSNTIALPSQEDTAKKKAAKAAREVAVAQQADKQQSQLKEDVALATTAYKDLSITDGLERLYTNGKIVKTGLSSSGNVKPLNRTALATFFTGSLLQALKPLNFSLKKNDGSTVKYKVSLASLQDNSVSIRLISEDAVNKGLHDVFYATLERDDDDSFWEVICYSDKALTTVVEKPYTLLSWQALYKKAILHGQNLPLIRMYEDGLISDRNLVAILYIYVEENASKKLLTANGRRVNIDKDTAKLLGQLFYDALVNDSNSRVYTLKQYLESYMSVNWLLVRDYILTKKTDSKRALAKLPATV